MIVGRKIKRIGDIEFRYPQWVDFYETPSPLLKGIKYETELGSFAQYIVERQQIPISIDSKNNDYISLQEKEAIENLWGNYDSFEVEDNLGNIFDAIFDYSKSIEFLPVDLGQDYFYFKANLILTI